MVKYPFLPQARQHIAKTELDFQAIIELPMIRARAKQRISAAFSLAKRLSTDPSKQFDVEIASYPLAIMLVSGIEDRLLIERFALLEAQQINLYLKLEKRKEVILEIAKAFNWRVKTEGDLVRLHVVKYLENASRGRLVHDTKWKLVNRAVDDGYVSVTPIELSRLLQEEVKKRIEDSTKRKLGDIPEEIQKDIDELKAEFLKMRPHLEEMDQIIRAHESEYPPCISILMKRAAEGKHLSHTERFTLVTYLIHQGVSIDSIVNLFSNVSDFKEAKTRYQVENLAGKTGGRTEPYTTYNCDTLRSHGVCTTQADEVCRTIRNPLTYHLMKQKLNPQKEIAPTVAK
jgi:DNA primase large subunit